MATEHKRLLILTFLAVFIFWQRAVLSPFLWAGLTAYILWPVAKLLERRSNLPRLYCVLAVYLTFLTALFLAFYFSGSRIILETKGLRDESIGLFEDIKRNQVNQPEWIRNLAFETLRSLEGLTLTLPSRVIHLFTGVVSRTVGLLFYLTTTFYLLKDGSKVKKAILKITEEAFSERMVKVVEEVERSFALYLKGQVFLVVFMSVLTFIVLTLMGVRFSLILAIFTGLAEIIPIVGPMVATLVASLVSAYDGVALFGLNPWAEAAVIAAVYFILRQFEDIVVIPTVMGRIAKVHPLMVMLAALIGGHLAGVWGLFLAVPTLSAIKILLENYW